MKDEGDLPSSFYFKITEVAGYKFPAALPLDVRKSSAFPKFALKTCEAAPLGGRRSRKISEPRNGKSETFRTSKIGDFPRIGRKAA